MARICQLLIIFVLIPFFCRCDNLTLDLSTQESNKGSNNINKTIYFIDGLQCRKYAPKPYNRIVKVVDGQRNIWRGGDAECTGAILYPETGEGKLLHLFLEKGNSNSHKYYSRDGEIWKEIDPVIYRSRMDEFAPKVPLPSGDPTKPSGKKKLGSSLVPSFVLALIIPALIITHIY